ncbi:MAG: putative collagen-binding domain-containing protein [Anaerolineae bacterium]
MQHARALIESGPYFDRLPDPSLVEPPNMPAPDYVATCRSPDGRYALAYFPSGKPAALRTFLLKGSHLDACWYDPRTGERHPLPPVEVAPWQPATFIPPDERDWVLILQSG